MGRAKVNVPDYMKYVDFGYERPGQDVRYSINCNYLKGLRLESYKNI